MNCKLCPYCHQKSYSAASYGKWVCPHCKNDITLVEYSPIIKELDNQIKTED